MLKPFFCGSSIWHAWVFSATGLHISHLFANFMGARHGVEVVVTVTVSCLLDYSDDEGTWEWNIQRWFLNYILSLLPTNLEASALNTLNGLSVLPYTLTDRPVILTFYLQARSVLWTWTPIFSPWHSIRYIVISTLNPKLNSDLPTQTCSFHSFPHMSWWQLILSVV